MTTLQRDHQEASSPPIRMTYAEACAYLESLQFFRIKLGLATMLLLLKELGQPQEALKFVHIAGTNGKGSVGITLATVFSQAGYKTGFYSSPHLHSVRERFRINGHIISQSEFAVIFSELRQVFHKTKVQPTYFECTTLAALLWFNRQEVDLAIMETGLGGRLDATNVITPLLSIITDISRDHEQYLGESIEQIAAEKAGIIKKGVPVVFSGRTGNSTAVIQGTCQKSMSPLYLLGRDFSVQPEEDMQIFSYTGLSGQTWHNLPLALSGQHQVINMSLTLAAMELLQLQLPLTEDTIRQALALVHWPGRMEHLHVLFAGKQKFILLDGAHNEAGVGALSEALASLATTKNISLVWANMADKEVGEAWHRLLFLSERIILTRADSPRSADPQDLWLKLTDDERQRARCADHAEEALNYAFVSANDNTLICVAGSLYLVGQLRHYLLEKMRASSHG